SGVGEPRGGRRRAQGSAEEEEDERHVGPMGASASVEPDPRDCRHGGGHLRSLFEREYPIAGLKPHRRAAGNRLGRTVGCIVPVWAPVTYAPSFAGTLYADISSKLAPALVSDLVAVSELNGKGVYAVPVADTSVLFAWNKAEYKQAGLDPEKAPTTFDELFAQ